ncbi:hypothetical protein BC833DRAFT_609515 [Globomyces pollinis-pini]|nr:hypothetical protein BC833DRAFT_609515 [Globomyces pollinis-pini]
MSIPTTPYELSTIRNANGEFYLFNLKEVNQSYLKNLDDIANLVNTNNQTIKCIKLFPLETTKFQNKGSASFIGNMTISDTIKVEFSPKNISKTFDNVNELSRLLTDGSNMDKEISNLMTLILQSDLAYVNLINSTKNVEFAGSLLSPSSSTILTNSFTSIFNSNVRVTGKNVKFHSTQIEGISSTVIGNESLLITVRSNPTASTVLNNMEWATFQSDDNPVIYSASQSLRFEVCPPYVLKNLPTTTQAKLIATKTFPAGLNCVNNRCSPISANRYVYVVSIIGFFFGVALIGLILRLVQLEEVSDGSHRDKLELYNQNLDLKMVEYYTHYPPGTRILSAPIKEVSMIPPRNLFRLNAFGPFHPSVEIGKMTHETGTQLIKLNTNVECNMECNAALMPRLLDCHISNYKLDTSQLPPPSFNSIHQNESKFECFYQVKIKKLPMNNPNLAIGFVTGSYPPFRLPGLCDQSIAFHCQDSTVKISGESVPFPEIELFEGDTIGIGYYTIVDSQSTNTNFHFYFTFLQKRYQREFILNNLEINSIRPSIGSGCDCEVELIFGPKEIAFAKIT